MFAGGGGKAGGRGGEGGEAVSVFHRVMSLQTRVSGSIPVKKEEQVLFKPDETGVWQSSFGLDFER